MLSSIPPAPLDSRGHAVVIGASIAGLLAARVLQNYFQQVTVVDQDTDTETPSPRKGVPQGRQAHVLLAGGASALARLFPNLFSELLEQGSTVVDISTGELRWFHYGAWKLPPSTKILGYSQTRPFLEWHLKRRLALHNGIRFLTATTVTGLQTEPQKQRITGVRIQSKNEETAKILAADLVIDASGRGSKSPNWLENSGYPRPQETRVGIHLGYGSRFYRPPPAFKSDWKFLAIYPKPPSSTKFGVILPVEGNRWLVTLVGVLRDYPPEDDEGFLQFAKALDHPAIYQALEGATALTPTARYRFPTYLRRHYERLTPFPEGFLVIGDGMCSFNPIYGQGITVCALEAEALETCLRHYRGNLSSLSREYFKKAAQITDTAWRMATGVDFLYPQTEGKRPLGTPLMNWFHAQLLELSARDRKIATTFHEVLHFLKPPTALFHPYILTQVLKSGLK